MTNDHSAQLEKARERLARATVRRDAEQARLDNRHWTELDPAVGSGIRRKPNRRADERRRNTLQRSADAFTEFDAASEEVARLERRVAAERAEAERVPFTRDDIVGAEFIHDGFSWRQVRKVNAKTVSVETGFSWVDRVPFEKIRSVRRVS